VRAVPQDGRSEAERLDPSDTIAEPSGMG